MLIILKPYILVAIKFISLAISEIKMIFILALLMISVYLCDYGKLATL